MNDRRHSVTTIALLALLGAAAAGPGPLRGQEAEGPTVPREFMTALMVGYPTAPTDGVELLPGRLTDALSELLELPADARIVGSVAQSARSVSAIAVPEDALAARSRWIDLLEGAGLERHRRPASAGFGPSPRETLQFCDATSTYTLGVHDGWSGGSLVKISRTGDSVCELPERRASARRGSRSPIPSLAPPPGAIQTGSSMGGGQDGWDALGSLRTRLAVTELLEHYAEQLVEEGWEPLERVAGEELAAMTFTFVDEEDREWHVLLSVSKAPGAETAHASLRLVPVGDPA